MTVLLRLLLLLGQVSAFLGTKDRSTVQQLSKFKPRVPLPIFQFSHGLLPSERLRVLPFGTLMLYSWPDGSLKWSGHALPANTGTASQKFTVLPGTPAEPASPVSVSRNDSVTVTTGSFSGVQLVVSEMLC